MKTFDLVDSATGELLRSQEFFTGPGDLDVLGKGWSWQERVMPPSSPYHDIVWDAGRHKSVMKPLDAVRSIKRNQLTDEFNKRLNQGVMVSGTQIATGRDAQGDLERLVKFLEGSGGTQKFKTRSGERKTVDLATARAIYAAVELHVAACWKAEYDHDAAIEALTTGQEIIDYDLTVGWPGV